MIKKIYCPCCGKWLFSIEVKAQGIVYIWCKGCKQEIKITLEPLSH